MLSNIVNLSILPFEGSEISGKDEHMYGGLIAIGLKVMLVGWRVMTMGNSTGKCEGW